MIEIVFTLSVIAVSIAVSVVGSRSALNPVTVSVGPIGLAFLVLLVDPVDQGFFSIQLSTAILVSMLSLAFALPFFVNGTLRPCPNRRKVAESTRAGLSGYPTLAIAFLSLGCLAYLLKVAYHFDPFLLMDGWRFFITDVVEKENTLRDGFTVLHWTGLLGLIYAGSTLGLGRPSSYALRAFLLALALLYLTTLLGLFVKKWIIIGALLFVFSYVLSAGPRSYVYLLLVALFGVIWTGIHNFLRSGQLEVAVAYFTSYLSGPIIGLDRYLNGASGSHSLGAGLFSEFYNLASMFGLSMDFDRYNEFFFIDQLGSTTNVGTILRDPFLDAGVVGVAVFLVVLSSLAFWVWRRWVARGDIASLVLYSLLLTGLSLSFFGFVFGLWTIYVVLLHFAVEWVSRISIIRGVPKARTRRRNRGSAASGLSPFSGTGRA